jgi:hypothetical protein
MVKRTRRASGVKTVRRRSHTKRRQNKRSQYKRKYRSLKGGSEEDFKNCLNEKCDPEGKFGFDPTPAQMIKIYEKATERAFQTAEWKKVYEEALEEETINFADELGLGYDRAEYKKMKECLKENIQDCEEKHGKKTVRQLVEKYNNMKRA